MTISPNGRRPKTPEEKAQDAKDVQQASNDLHQLKDHYGSWAEITREWGIPKSSLEGIYKGTGKVVNKTTAAFISAALQLVWLKEGFDVHAINARMFSSRVELLSEENERLRRKIDVLSVHG